MARPFSSNNAAAAVMNFTDGSTGSNNPMTFTRPSGFRDEDAVARMPRSENTRPLLTMSYAVVMIVDDAGVAGDVFASRPTMTYGRPRSSTPGLVVLMLA